MLGELSSARAGSMSIPFADVKVEPERKIDLRRVAYFRNNADYDYLLVALLNKVNSLLVSLDKATK